MKTSINVILDRSGSMGPLRADTIGGFNAFLAEQKAVPGEATLTLAQFNDSYVLVHDGVPLADVKPLDDASYAPSGNTALFDAIGRTIDSTGAKFAAMSESERPARVVVVIVTDGEENASREYDRARVLQMIAHQRDVYKWDFVFLGAGEGSLKDARSIGIMDALVYTASKQGTSDLYAGVSRGVAAYRAGGSSSLIAPVKKP